MFGAPSLACSIDLGDWSVNQSNDPRTGTNKKVIFSSGCASSVTMPVGAKDTITVSSADSKVALPTDLEPKSSDPTVIEIQNPSPTTFDIHALKKGQTDLEVWSKGARFDFLTFHVEPAKVVKFVSEPSVVAGGRTWVVLTDVFGACGTDECPLFGHDFMLWSVEPAASFTFIEEKTNIGHYRAGVMPGSAELVGKEPSEGGELFRQTIEIVDPSTITAVQGTLQESKIESDSSDPPVVPFPAQVRPSNSFTIRVQGKRNGKDAVNISRLDIDWIVPQGITPGLVVEPSDIYGSTFSTSEMTGTFTLTAKIGILGGKEQQFVVTVAK